MFQIIKWPIGIILLIILSPFLVYLYFYIKKAINNLPGTPI